MPSQGHSGQRGYNYQHQKLRAQWAPKVATGTVECRRCHDPIRIGQPWDLGHDDHDRTITRGPEHALRQDCRAGGNRATAGRHAWRRTTEPHPGIRASRL